MRKRGFGQRARIEKAQRRGEGDNEKSRLVGPCELCGKWHAFPDVRDVCLRCGADVCITPCQCWRDAP